MKNLLHISIAIAALFLSSHQTALAADAEVRMTDKEMRASDTRYGHASRSVPDRVVMLEPGKVKQLNVKRFETIKFTDGQNTVTWTFDTAGTPNFALSEVFPGAAGTVYVDESPIYAF